MRLSDHCLQCLYEKEERIASDEDYLSEVWDTISRWDVTESAPYMEYVISGIHEKRFGKTSRYSEIKKQFNDFVLSMADNIRARINSSDDPLKASLFMARIGNYIDFGALKDVSPDDFIRLLSDWSLSCEDEAAYISFLSSCSSAKSFLLLADNSGEIVLDTLMLEQLHKRFPQLELFVMVRGGEVLNDATIEDACYVGTDRIAKTVGSGVPVAGAEYRMLSAEAKAVFDAADLILAKGQGNYECVSGCGKHVFFSFLCKCDVFVQHFNVPRYTGMLIEEK